MKTLVISLLLSSALVFAQDFSGTYSQQDDPNTTLELSLSASGYTGIINDPQGQFRLEAELNGSLLYGFVFLTEAGYAQNMYFEAELSGTSLNMATAFLDARGQIDQNSLQQFVFVRSAPASNPIGQTSNPLGQAASSGQANPLGQSTSPGQASPSGQTGNPLGQSTSPEQTNPLGQQTNPLGQTTATSASPPLAAGSAAGNTLQANQQYQAGTVLNSPWAGVNFSIPQGFIGGYEASEGVFISLAQDQSTAIIMQAASEMNAEQLATVVLEKLASSFGEETQSFLVVAPQQQGDTITVTYNVDGYTLHASARQGPTGNAIVFVGYGLQAQTVTEQVNSQSAAVTFFAPQAGNLNTQLGGTDFYSNKTDNYYSPGGAGDGGFASGTERSFTFCSNGAYGYQYSSESFFSVEGAGSASSTESDAHQGNWAISQTLMGDIALLLQASDGRTFMHVLEQVPEGVLIDGFLYQVSASQQCG